MKVSVIIPVYNVEAYLPRCMESVLGQTLRELEIILVDDGSTDGSGALCDAYGKQDGRIRVIHKENGGLSDARNAGLEIASGDYIGYVDSDDWVERTMFERLLDCCTESGADVAVCRYTEEYEGYGLHNTNNSPAEDLHNSNTIPIPFRSPEILSRDRALWIYLTDPEGYSIYNSVWSKLFKASLVQDMRFFTGHNSEDIPYTTEAFCRMEKAVYLDEALYHYVVGRAGGIMHKDAGRLFRDEIPHWRWHSACIRRYGMEELAKLSEYQYYKRMLAYDLRLSGEDRMRLEDLLLSEEDRIREIYSEAFVKKSDRMRMKLFLRSPGLYRMADALLRRLRHQG